MKLVRKRETDKELAHTDVYIEDVYVGYIIPDNPMVGSNFHFCGTVTTLMEATKADLLKAIEEFYKTNPQSLHG